MTSDEYRKEMKKKRKKELEEKAKNGRILTSDEYREYYGIKTVSVKEKEEDTNKWFKSGTLKDGYQFGDITGGILGTAGDVVVNAGKGVLGLVEGVTDLVQYGASGITSIFDEKKAQEIKQSAMESWTDKLLGGLEEGVDKYSFLGDKSDNIAQGIGYVGGIVATGGIGGAMGLGSAGATALTTGATFLSSMGGGMGEAYKEGASDIDAVTYGAIKGAGDAVTELLFGGLGKAVGAVGLSSGISSLDDVFAQKLSSKVTNQVAKNFIEFGVKAGAEGTEEVLAGVISAVGKKVSYMEDEELAKLVEDEKLLDQFIAGAITSGFAQSGYVPGMTKGSLREANKTGRDFISGYTQNEQSIVDKLSKQQIEQQERESGKKLTKKEQNSVKEEIETMLKRGEIDIDTIEQEFGGESYTAFDSLKKEADEYDKLANTPTEKLSLVEQKRRDELDAKHTEKSYVDRLMESKQKLVNDVRNATKNDMYLQESFAEKGRRGEAFKLSEEEKAKYTEEELKIVNKAVEMGEINNTRKAHEMVDFVAKVSTKLGVDFDFMNNKKLAEAGYIVEGKTIDGFKKGNAIAVNLQSKKALNSVVGHEITHVLEGTKLYDALQTTLKEYATTKGVYNSLFETAKENYKNVYTGLTEAEYTAKIEQEVTSDLVGEYIFSDIDFVRNLSTKNPNVFQKVFNEIKYMLKVATAGSDAEKQLLKAKKIFEDVYKDSKINVENIDIRYSMSDNIGESKDNDGGDRYVRTDEFKRLQEESRRMSDEDIQLYHAGNKQIDDRLRTNLAGVLRSQLIEHRNGLRNDYGVLELSNKGNNFNMYEAVDGSLFHDVFEIVQKHLRNGELVDLHAVETTDDGIGYNDTVNYLSEDGLSGFSITPDGDLISVFNASDKKGFLGAIAPHVKKNAKNNSIAPTKETPNNGVFFDGKTQASLSDPNRAIAPTKNGIYAEDVALERPIGPVRADQEIQIAPDVTGMTTRMQESEIEMQNEMFPPMAEEDAHNMLDSDEDWERLRSMQEMEETPSVDEPMYSNDTASLSEADLREVRKSIKDKLPLQRGRTQEFNEIVQRYSTSEYPNLDALFYEIKDNFGTISVTEEIAEVVEVQKMLKNTRINVSDSIKKGVTDYVKTMRRNSFKIRFSKDGMPVDVVYQELSELYPNMFPEDIANEVDQFEQILSVANMTRTESGEFEIDNETIYETVNSLVNTVRDIRMRHNQNVAERRSRWFDKDTTLEEYMQTDDFAELEGNPNLLRVFQERWDRNRLTTEPQIDDTVAQILDSEPQAQKKGFKENIKRKWAVFKANFIDKGAVFEDLSKVTKNRNLEAKWDYTMLSDAQAQHYMQNGVEDKKSLDNIREEVENTGFSREFSEYMYHYLNIDRMTLDARYGIENKTVFGSTVTADVSKQKVSELESTHPEFKAFAQDVYDYMSDLRQRMVQNGILSQETADMWAEMYPHYVPIRRVDSKGMNVNVPLATDRTGVNAPIKKATGGNSDILPLFDTMAQRTMQTFKAINKNDFGIELKNTLGSTISRESQSIDNAVDMVETQDALLQAGENGYNPTFTVFENGQRVTFEITQEMYEALLPMSDKMRDSGSKILQKASSFHRGVLTEYNPVFALTNGIKDMQDILINSQHPAKTYAKIVEATQQLLNKGQWYQEYMKHGGENNSYFDTETNSIAPTKKGVLDTFPLKQISNLNNFIERVPRLAEYIASREMGRSVQESMLDSARVTTNFKAGGDVTKFLNKNGATFLNASMQGFNQQVRNVREANMNGLKGWGLLATKFAVAGLPALLLNHLLWDDDEEYQELSDYVKQNYYVVGKYGDGQFIRIPKGRTVAVIQEAFNQMDKLATGNDEADLGTFLEVLTNNLAPNNPISNNVVAPLVQAVTNKTWYGEDLVPQRLQDSPSAEQYDESTDKFSKAVGKALNISPMKINYVLDQYTGLVGDMILPALTPEVTSGSEGALGYAIAPLKDKFTTDGVMNKQVITDFYSKSEELTKNANKTTATNEDILKNKYLNSVKAEMNNLYKQKREIQNSDLSNKEKYAQVRDVQRQISALAEEGMSNFENAEVYEYYGKVNDRHFHINSDGEWQKVTDKQLAKQEKVTSSLNISANDYWGKKEEYDYAYENPGRYGIAKAIGGYDSFVTYNKALNQIEADKNIYGESINGSKKVKVVSYLNNMNADYYTKIMLFKSEYPADDRYNTEIVEYLNSRDDISYQEMVDILTELDFKVSADGTIRW